MIRNRSCRPAPVSARSLCGCVWAGSSPILEVQLYGTGTVTPKGDICVTSFYPPPLFALLDGIRGAGLWIVLKVR